MLMICALEVVNIYNVLSSFNKEKTNRGKVAHSS